MTSLDQHAGVLVYIHTREERRASGISDTLETVQVPSLTFTAVTVHSHH